MKFYMLTLVAFLSAFSMSAAHASLNVDSDLDVRPHSFSLELRGNLIQAFERKLERRLTLEERDNIVAFVTTAILQDSDTMVASNENGVEDVTTWMICVGAKGAAAVKLAGALCMDLGLNTFILGVAGKGFSLGVAGNAFVLVHKGLPGTIKGDYVGLEVGISSAMDLAKVAVPALVKSIGGEIGYMTNSKNGSVIFFGGLAIGPMIDISAQAMTIY